MKYLLLLLNFFAVSVFANVSEVSENIEVFKGDRNLKVSLTRILPLENNQALMMISGVEHKLNNIVLKYDIETNGNYKRFKTQFEGSDIFTLIDSVQGSEHPSLSLPGIKSKLYLSFDNDLSSNASSAELLKKHQQQKSEGVLAKLQSFNRDNENAKILEAIESQNTLLNEACTSPIKLSIDLDTITDEVIKKFSVASYCGNTSNEIIRLCKKEESKSWVNSNIESINCKFGDKLRIKLDNKALNFQTYPEGENQSDFVKQNLINIR